MHKSEGTTNLVRSLVDMVRSEGKLRMMSSMEDEDGAVASLFQRDC